MVTAPMKISYCTTCKGRLHHLRETLPANMAAEKDNPNVEFVVLDYGDDGQHGDLGAWIKEMFSNEIESGRLRYARHEAKDFQMAHAKNMAHRLATGDVLVNIDADNFIPNNYSRWLTAQFEKHPQVAITHLPVRHRDPWMRRLKAAVGKLDMHHPSTSGRIAVTRDQFESLGGYDETYSAHGNDDWDMVVRARDAGSHIILPGKEQFGTAIDHSDEERIENLSAKDKQISQKRMEEHAANRNRPKPQRFAIGLASHLKLLYAGKSTCANANGNVGCGEVTINFADAPTTIGPIPSAVEQPVQEETMSVTTISDAGRRADWAATHGSRPPQIGKSGR